MVAPGEAFMNRVAEETAQRTTTFDRQKGMNCSVLVLFPAIAVSAQTRDVRPAYEVASIKPNTSLTDHTSSHGSKGQIALSHNSLKRLVEQAYSVKSFQVTGPAWMENVYFDIVAKYPAEAEHDARTLMLRTLLEDRFKLAAHLESKEMPGYVLVAAKRGFKLKPVDAGPFDTDVEGGMVRTLTAKKVSMARLADLMARNLGAMVVDKTGVDGVYDFTLRWSNDDRSVRGSEGETAPSLFTALQESLGLQLKAEKVPVEIVVVDHVDREPSEN
jgi:uncharacterized protein (TIGR03435 family)